MPPKESLVPRDWGRIAEKDWGRVERMLRDHDVEAAGFYLQQAVEKFLKAYLLSRGWRLQRIHDLEALLNDAVARDSSLETYRSACQTITGYYTVERYPGLPPSGLCEDDIRQSQQQILGLVEKLRAAISGT